MQKIGILGGGQLGRMLLQASANYPVETFLMENDPGCPAAHLCHHFVEGDITKYEDVYNFGKGLDAMTIEIESVNEEALLQLEEMGVRVYPRPSALSTIKNKILQKQFYLEYDIPTGSFYVTENQSELHHHAGFFPALHKIAKGGYDGRGVVAMNSPADIDLGFDEPALLEKKIDIRKEISIIIAVNDSGEMAVYPPVEMIFDPILNMLNYQLSPAQLEEKILWKIEAIATRVVKNLQSPGIFAVEMFIDQDKNIWVNETAPRVHNSGHHTIEANYSSQFDMLWRIMLGYPLGNTKHIMPAAMVNVVGAIGYYGPARLVGLDAVLGIENVFVHLYGKKITKPGRKMGHVTILSNDRQELVHISHTIKQLLQVISE